MSEVSNPPLRVAVLQMTSTGDGVINAHVLREKIAEAASAGARVIFTPECTNMVHRKRSHLLERAVPTRADPCYQAAAEEAGRHKVWVVLGSILVREEGESRLRNRCVVFDDHGEQRAHYDKIHLFDASLGSGENHRESAGVLSGDRAVVVETPWLKMGLAICYDVRFASLFRVLAHGGAELLSTPAAFTVPSGEAHWHVLQRARAIETGSYVVAAAQTGTHPCGRQTYGHSLVVSPWGEVLADGGSESGTVLLADLPLDAVASARSKISSLRHDRPFAVPHSGHGTDGDHEIRPRSRPRPRGGISE